MAGRLLQLSARAASKVPKAPFGAASAHGGHESHGESDWMKVVIGNREVVGYGLNGAPVYTDRSDFPMPAIRWKEPTSDIKMLREKEKGDWRQLSMEEKKALYRASFRQTFAEFKAPTGQWKSTIGVAMMLCAASIWIYYGMKVFVYNPLPSSFEEEKQKAQLRRMLDMKMNPVTGIASKWDYENNKWK